MGRRKKRVVVHRKIKEEYNLNERKNEKRKKSIAKWQEHEEAIAFCKHSICLQRIFFLCFKKMYKRCLRKKFR